MSFFKCWVFSGYISAYLIKEWKTVSPSSFWFQILAFWRRRWVIIWKSFSLHARAATLKGSCPIKTVFLNLLPTAHVQSNFWISSFFVFSRIILTASKFPFAMATCRIVWPLKLLLWILCSFKNSLLCFNISSTNLFVSWNFKAICKIVSPLNSLFASSLRILISSGFFGFIFLFRCSTISFSFPRLRTSFNFSIPEPPLSFLILPSSVILKYNWTEKVLIGVKIKYELFH